MKFIIAGMIHFVHCNWVDEIKRAWLNAHLTDGLNDFALGRATRAKPPKM